MHTHMHVCGHTHQPGVLVQLNKINQLIVDLRQKESAYLNQLLMIMVNGWIATLNAHATILPPPSLSLSVPQGKEDSISSTRPQVGTESMDDTLEDGTGYSEDESVSGEEEEEEEGGRREGTGREVPSRTNKGKGLDDSLSLKAEVEQVCTRCLWVWPVVM